MGFAKMGEEQEERRGPDPQQVHEDPVCFILENKC